MDSVIFNNIKKFTTEQAGVMEERVTENASLEDDLGIYGDDAVEYLVAFGKKFKVDVSGFMAADYFSGEGDVILPALLQHFKNNFIRPKFISNE